MKTKLSTCLATVSVFVVALTLQVHSIAEDHTEPDPTAEAVMVRAHDARAVWKDWPGFSAELTVSINGKESVGKFIVSPRGKLKLELPDGPQATWAERHLASLIRHRLPREGDRTFHVTFADEVSTHPLGRLIRFEDDPLQSAYRISGDAITEVHRTMNSKRFTITVLETSRNAESQILPRCYSVSWWDAKSGNLTACDMIHNEWVRLGRWDLPAQVTSIRTEEGGEREVGRISLRNHRLLQE